MKANKSQPIAAFLALLLAFVFGTTQTTVWAADKGTMSANETKFIKQTGEHGMAEVKIAELGSQKAERADVKEFATMLVNDHTKANSELAALAKTKGVELSQMIAPKAADTFKDLEKESGQGFDKAFLAQMEKSHKDTISSFEDAEKDAKDGELKAWISKTLPTLKAHLDKVKELRAK